MPLLSVIDQLKSFDASEISLTEVADRLKEATQLKAIAEATFLSVVAQAEALAAARTFGYRTTSALVAATTGDRLGRARSEVEFTKTLGEHPTVAAPFSEGELTRPKVKEILRAVDADEQKQAELVETAKSASVKKLREIVSEYLAEKGVEPQRVKNEVSVKHVQGGGSLTLTLEPVRLNLMEIAMDMAVAKMKLSKNIPYAERRAEALVTIAKFFVEHVDNESRVRGSRPHVSVTIDLDTLEGRANRPARLENGQFITGEAARQMCCDAGITRIVSGPRSQPLDVGTETRNFPAPMAKAIIARDKHCVHEGCEAPPWACEIHHIKPVAQGGETSAANGELRCWFHHDVKHDELKGKRRDAYDAIEFSEHSEYVSLAA